MVEVDESGRRMDCGENALVKEVACSLYESVVSTRSARAITGETHPCERP
jgi:hypothetical protein